MSDTEMTPQEPPPLFFAGSDDEEDNEDVPMEPSAPSSSRPSSRASSRLFLDDSDDEKPELVTPSKRPIYVEDDSDNDAPPVKLEKVSAGSGKAGPSRTKASAPASKKRRISSPTLPEMPPTYIGEMIFGHAWSNVSGKGYIKISDEVKIMREPREEKKNGSSGTKNKNLKQMSLKAMMKQPAKASSSKNKKTDNIVRLYNSRGFEFGRLPQDVSAWMAKLLDLGIVEFRGKMTDCPEKLSTGATLIVTADVYMLPAAFQPSNIQADDGPLTMFSEGAETLDEQMLRERKASILKLFDVLGLRPQAGANFVGRKSDEEIHEEAVKKMAQHKSNKKVTEIVGDGEEIEVDEDDGEELSENDLDMIYQKAQKSDRTMGEMDPPNTFTFTLRGYQKQALLWMHSLELGKMDAREAASMHPLWSQYAFPHPQSDGGAIDLTADEKPFYFNPYSGQLSLEFPKAERKGRGGILADVGLGTIMLAALIHTNCEPDTERPADESAPTGTKHRQLKLNNAFKKAPRRKTQKAPSSTLIVAPTSLLSQWEGELQRCSKPGTLKVLLWHGQNRLDLEDVLEEEDGDAPIKVIITSYGVLASEHAKSEKKSSSKSPVFEIEWLRVVLDEAHSCKSRSSKTAKAVYALNARRRWAVTGTPIVNKLEDLYSLLKFLDFRPWSDFSFFRSFITLPFLARDPKAIEIVQIILESILLRREKNMVDANGKRIVELPQKDVVVEYLEFSTLERKIYNSLFNSAKRDFQQLDAKGLIGKNYTHILAMLMRLRRAVLHPNLVLASDDQRALPEDGDGGGDGTVDVNELIKCFANDERNGTGEGSGGGNVFAQNALENLELDEADSECLICCDIMQSPMLIPECMHRYCKDCIVAALTSAEEQGNEPRCPSCQRGPIKESDLIEIFRPPKSSQDPQPSLVLRKNDFHSSTKLEALVQNLRKLREQDPCFRAVVFSQFTSFLDLIQVALKRERFEQYRFDGSMDVKKRGLALDAFRSPTRRPKVLIVSLKAGGVGLNLTTANHVFMMDCWWNAATENQAIDRVHRIGQLKTVYVKHFIVSNTIEGRILRIQKRKTAIVKEAFRGSGAGPGKSDPESIENLKIMFGEDTDDE
ncbi:DNA repair protein RAD5 [Mycena maculata]|uniref:DNA repair protein RAD5 n=1 Tax=Mycena maculata TaxID=230809 RepID=A0AAD7JDI3_9AGAR|nr:DNA repair protein RAD5 [Mycena maculata]